MDALVTHMVGGTVYLRGALGIESGAAHAGDWVAKARRYVAAHRALDEIESAALLPGATAAR